jgi:glucoside 3-dehydrogenase (cytochrome c) hitch-hiker subunit
MIQDPTATARTRLTRRDVLISAIALVGGSAGLIGCSRDSIDELRLHDGAARFFDADQMRMLGRLVDIIIPATDTPGALAAGVDVFLDSLMADWASATTSAKYVTLLRAIDARARAEDAKRFADCEPDRQVALLRDIDSRAFGANAELPEFREFKELVLAGYYTSEIGASVELQFELVPGRYLECVPVGQIGRAWAYT